MSRGGYRPGAGRPRGSKIKVQSGKPDKANVQNDNTLETTENLDPLSYMLKVMNNPNEDKELRTRMAQAAAPYMHARKGEGQGKKNEKADRAKSAGLGKFAPSKPPLALVRKDNH